LLKGLPVEEGQVKRAAELITPTMHHIYGDLFDVKVCTLASSFLHSRGCFTDSSACMTQATDGAINVAYTTEELEPHVDLAYYESAPGIQMLMCHSFGAKVIGGESTFVDAFLVAQVCTHRVLLFGRVYVCVCVFVRVASFLFLCGMG